MNFTKRKNIYLFNIIEGIIKIISGVMVGTIVFIFVNNILLSITYAILSVSILVYSTTLYNVISNITIRKNIKIEILLSSICITFMIFILSMFSDELSNNYNFTAEQIIINVIIMLFIGMLSLITIIMLTPLHLIYWNFITNNRQYVIMTKKMIKEYFSSFRRRMFILVVLLLLNNTVMFLLFLKLL